ncbi:hypothetical protein CRUP_013346, partial [Coryphaenoides rupestris]
MLGVGSGPPDREPRGFDPRHHRRAGPTGVRGQAASQSAENMQQMKMMMEQEMKSDKYKSSSSSRGYVFTLMPLYAVGVGVFALYKFLKMKAADETQTEREKAEKGARKSSEADGSGQGNLDKLIESLAAREATPTEEAPLIGHEQAEDFLGAEPELQEEEEQNRRGGGGEEEEAPPTLQQPWKRGVENLGAGCEELPV